jgi:integrase
MTDTFRPVALVCALSGLRASEALGLTWADVDFKGETITVRAQLGPDGKLVPVKSRPSAAPVPLLPRLARELKTHRSRAAARGLGRIRPASLVFTTTRGRPQSRRNALRAVHAAAEAAKLNGNGRQPVGLHDLRHSFVANALAAGVTLPEAAILARHANARTTAVVYAGITEQAREKIAAKLLAAGLGQ